MAPSINLFALLTAIVELLFSTSNVTLAGTAEFRMNGERFKSMDARYVQDGGDSFWQLHLSSPRKDGAEIKNGFTIICNEVGDRDARITVMPVFEPGVYRTMTEDQGQPSLVSPSAAMKAVADLALQLAPVAETALPEGAFTAETSEDGGTLVRLRLAEGEATPLMNAALTAIALPVAQHLFRDEDLTYDQYWGDGFTTGIESYFTVAKGLLWEVRSLRLRTADVSLTLDGEGRLTAAKGTVALDVDTQADGTVPWRSISTASSPTTTSAR